jgi:murein DD-endopeptidase MepM/ murein hydrolase activator NlpD
VMLAILAVQWPPQGLPPAAPEGSGAGILPAVADSAAGAAPVPVIFASSSFPASHAESADGKPAGDAPPGTNPTSASQQAPPAQDTAPTEAPARREPHTHTVAPGDTVSGIADMFGVSVQTILWTNDLWDADSIQVGDELAILPVSGVLHRIGAGDNVNYLALVYDVAAEEIVEFNDLADPDMLQVGDRLIVPGGTIQPGRGSGSSRGGRPTPVATGSFRWPAAGFISQYFGENGHSGLDIGAQWGAPIYAADTGVVVTALKLSTGYGWYLVIDHENGYRTLYSHLSAFHVDYGERVVKGEVIGLVGSTGLSTGPHLHFEIFQNGVRVNPLNFLP